MRNFMYLMVVFCCFLKTGQAQNISLAGTLPYPAQVLSNICGYTDAQGNEYALVGAELGVDIVDITDPANPVSLFFVNGNQSIWREIKTFKDHAFITTEGGGGLKVVDLTSLPASIAEFDYLGDSLIAAQLETIHALHIDTSKGFCYLYGTNLFDGGAVILDINNPAAPHFVGYYQSPIAPYIHDGYADNDTLYACHIYEGILEIVDCSDKANPISIATQYTPTEFTHNSWLTNDKQHILTTDENSGSFLAVYNISNPSNIQEVARTQVTPGSGSIVHNTHVLNDFAVTSWYTDGITIHDVARPHNPVLVGSYDTYPQGSGPGFNGCWGVFPFFPSGAIVASDIQNGLFVFSPNYVRACYLEGIITDSLSGLPINGASITIQLLGVTQNSKIAGDYAMGTATAGTYTILISKPGYIDRTISGVVLTNGQLTTLNVALLPLTTFLYSGTVIDSVSSQPIPAAFINFQGNDTLFQAVADAAGNFTVNLFAGVYTVSAGKWGYRTNCILVSANDTSPQLNIAIAQGYYDDFTFDYNWQVSGSSPNAWERGEPIGTSTGGSAFANPEIDVTQDCNDKCFVTDNGGGGAFDNDVDNGNTLLTSPVFDATIYANPVISYYRWFTNYSAQGGAPNDTMIISITNGSTEVILEKVTTASGPQAIWRYRTYSLASLITITNTMQLKINAEDYPQGNGLECAIDKFEVTGQLLSGSNELNSASLIISPNPANDLVTINFGGQPPLALSLQNIQGQLVKQVSILSSNQAQMMVGDLAPGLYLVSAKYANGSSTNLKFIKQ